MLFCSLYGFFKMPNNRLRWALFKYMDFLCDALLMIFRICVMEYCCKNDDKGRITAIIRLNCTVNALAF